MYLTGKFCHMEPWRTGKVIRIEDATYNTRRFWIQVPDLEKFNFKPGQFVTLDLPIHEKPNKRWRSYSIASHPDGSNVFELVIVLLDGGLGTNYLFNHVRVGTTIPVRGPQGVFTLPEEMNKDMFLICTGTGIAPFRSMANYIQLHNLPHQKIHLIYGCRQLKDGLYGYEMKQLEAGLHGFSYLPTYSRETAEDVRKGYVHAVYEDIIQQHNKPCAHFFLCGWKNMIDDARKKLLELGYAKTDIHFELYG